MSGLCSESEYILPLDYQDNKVTLLAKDPSCLYAYWDLSGNRKENFCHEFGNDIWEKSVPVLKVINVSRNKSFNIRINDFSSNWYIYVDEPDCLYTAEIGRVVSERYFINLASSNYAAAPRNTVSSNSNALFVDYRELKNKYLDPNEKVLFESFGYDYDMEGIIGLSSPELFSTHEKDSSIGLSSAELFGAGIKEYLGLSSGGFYGI
ncbi:MAG: DUF4912 domain-containing protein [Bacillota bacterium]|nr:DUF4912 domain-containing protein [Bacillota bacterium]